MAYFMPASTQRKSPPKHRHDGTSPLPLGMDWSPPPRKWDGRDTIWPHDPRTGWSYCVTIPSWTVQKESRSSNGALVDPVVFYRVQVGIQSPEGISVARVVLRRFSDFLKLYNTLKRLFPGKNIPPSPPKHRFSRINSSQQLLEVRRCSLEEWMGNLLCEIDLSRSIPVASFLELEAAARSSFQDGNPLYSSNNPNASNGGSSSFGMHPTPGVSVVTSRASTTAKALSTWTDYCSDNTYEASDMGTPSQGRDLNSEIGSDDLLLDQDLTSTIASLAKSNTANDENLLLLGETLLNHVIEYPGNIQPGKDPVPRDNLHQNASTEFLSDLKRDRLMGHARNLSTESTGSDMSSVRGSEVSNSGVANSGGNTLDHHGDAEVAGLQFSNNVEMVLPLDQRNKMSRVLTTMQRRLVTAKTDMEDLIARLNQEIAVKEYLTTKVKDLNVELETSKQKSKENMQQAILVERERVTQMQWDMEEFRRKSSEMESMLKLEQDQRIRSESAIIEKESLQKELDGTREQLERLRKRQEDLELKSKADIKVLVKEVKSLRKTQAELKQELSQSLKEKAELERILQNEKERKEKSTLASEKLLHECGVLRHRLQECSVNFLVEEEDKFNVTSSLTDALDLLTTSDNRIGLLLAEAQLVAQEGESTLAYVDDGQANKFHDNLNVNGVDQRDSDDEVRKMLTDIFIDNARLRKQMNSIMRCALKTAIKPNDEGDEAFTPRKTVLNKFLER